MSNFGLASGSRSLPRITTCCSFSFCFVMGEGGVQRGEIAVGSRMIFSFEYAKSCLVQRDRGLRKMCVETPDVFVYSFIFVCCLFLFLPSSLPPPPGRRHHSKNIWRLEAHTLLIQLLTFIYSIGQVHAPRL